MMRTFLGVALIVCFVLFVVCVVSFPIFTTNGWVFAGGLISGLGYIICAVVYRCLYMEPSSHE